MNHLSSTLNCYFQTLKLPKTATEKEIKAAYRRLARLYHPDVNPDKSGAAEKFKEISEAYHKLLEYVRQRSKQSKSNAEPDRAPADSKIWKKDAAENHFVPSWRHSNQKPFQSTVPDLSPDEQNRVKPDLLRNLRLLLKRGDWQQVVRSIEDCAASLQVDREIRQVKAKAYYARAIQLLEQWQYDNACGYLQEAVWFDPHNTRFCHHLKRVHLYTGRLRELKAFGQALDRAYPHIDKYFYQPEDQRQDSKPEEPVYRVQQIQVEDTPAVEIVLSCEFEIDPVANAESSVQGASVPEASVPEVSGENWDVSAEPISAPKVRTSRRSVSKGTVTNLFKQNLDTVLLAIAFGFVGSVLGLFLYSLLSHPDSDSVRPRSMHTEQQFKV